MDMIRRFPQYLNAPLQLAWWEADVVAVALFSGYAGFFLKGPFYLIIILQPWLYVRFKKQYPRGFMRHLFYFIGLTDFKGYPSFFEKRFVE
jgi:type IV conjugative transfer system protein TraL